MGPIQLARIVCAVAVLRGCEHLQYLSFAESSDHLPRTLVEAAFATSHTCSRVTSFPRPLLFPSNYTPALKSLYPEDEKWRFVDTLFVSDLRPAWALAYIEKKMESWKMMSRLPWLLIVDTTSHQEALRDLTWRLDNKVIFLEVNGSEATFSEAYRTEKNALPVVTQLGAVHNSSPLEAAELAKDPWNRRLNLTGGILRCVAANYALLNIVRLAPNGSVTQVAGLSGDVFHAVQSSLKLRTQYYFAKDDKLVILSNGEYRGGVLGDVFHGRADVGIPVFFRTIDRENYFDFSVAIGASSYSLAVKKSKYFLGSTTYTLEFSSLTWAAVLVLFVVNILILKMIMKNCCDREEASFVDCVIANVAIFCNMGTERIMSRSPSYRVWLMTILLSVILLHVSYSSSLITLLTIDNNKLPFKDLRGLYEARSEYTLSVEKGTLVENFFVNAKKGLPADVYRDMIVDHPEYIEDMNSSLKRLMEQPRHAIFYSFLLPLTDCRIVRFKKKTFEYPIVFPFPMRHPIRPIMNIQLMKVLSAGILNRIKKKWNVGQKSIFCERQPAIALGLQETVTAFYILGFGLVLSALILLLECAVDWLPSYRKSDRPPTPLSGTN